MTRIVESLSKSSNLLVGLLLLTVVSWMLLRQTAQPLNIEPSTDPLFQTQVASEKGLVLVKFGAQWCGPCLATDKAIDSVRSELSQYAKIVTIDIDANPELAQHYHVSSIPHSFLFYHGRIEDHRIGGMDEKELLSWAKSMQHVVASSTAK